MQQRFHIFIRQHRNDWYTAQVLTHSMHAAFGPDLEGVKAQLQAVLAHELGEGVIPPRGTYFFPDLTRRALEVELRAVQHERLITVPMRLTLLERQIDPKRLPPGAPDTFQITIPRLGKSFQIVGRESITPWAEEVVRDHFHLEPVETLLAYQYERGERVEPLDVTFSGKAVKGGSRRSRRARSKGQGEGDEDGGLFFSWVQTDEQVLSSVGVELTEEARQDRLPRAALRDEDVSRLLATLSGGGHKSLILVGPAGSGKTAVLHEACHRLARQGGEGYERTPIWHVTGSRIIAGMRYLGEWQARALQIVRAIQATAGVLYVDNPLELIMAGSQGGMTVASCLTPFIRAGELTVIAEASPDTLRLAEQLDPAFIGSLRRQSLRPLTPEQAFSILGHRAEILGRAHKTRFQPEALTRALDLLARFGDVGALPGAGLTLIEQMARLGKDTLTPEDAVTAFARASGFPQGIVDPDALLDLDALRAFFTERIIGQPQIIDRLVHLISVIKAGLNDPEKPLGSFLFAGPTGVGKTESALTLAEYLFGDRDRLVRLDMSEYGYPGSAARLVGGPRGEGELTRRLRQQPFCVLLLDEIEKAESGVFDLLLQALGEGRLTDGTGRTASLRHAIVILTSNLGATGRRAIGLQAGGEPSGGRYLEAARAFFRPELLNRIDHVVPFEPLDEPAVAHIARRMLDKALAREGLTRRDITVTYAPEVIGALMAHGFDPRYGARPMKRAIEQQILTPLSRRLALRQGVEGERFELYVHGAQIEVVAARPVGQRTGALGSDGLRLTAPILAHDHLWRRCLAHLRARLQGWQESALIRSLRRADDPLISRLEALAASLDALAAPSEPPAAEAQAFMSSLLTLEWDLSLAASSAAEAITLEVVSLHPEVAPYARLYLDQLQRWAEGRGFTVAAEGPGVTVTGRGAGASLAGELGLHRVSAEGGTWDFAVQRPGGGAAEVIREISLDPPAVWDARTGVEIGGLAALHEGLTLLAVGWMSLSVR